MLFHVLYLLCQGQFVQGLLQYSPITQSNLHFAIKKDLEEKEPREQICMTRDVRTITVCFTSSYAKMRHQRLMNSNPPHIYSIHSLTRTNTHKQIHTHKRKLCRHTHTQIQKHVYLIILIPLLKHSLTHKHKCFRRS